MARILLADADAFFVGVARLADPEGAGQAPLLIVGGSRDSRGVVCSASYETRKFGVRSAMPIARALRLCPNAMCVPVPFKACLAKSAEIRDLLKKFAPVVETASVDEWYMDLSGTEAVYHHESLHTTAQRIRQGVHQATGLTVSIGGGTNKLIAKLAVDRAKPSANGAGIHIVDAGAEDAFLRSCTLADIPLVGPKFQARLAARGLVTVEDVLRLNEAALRQWLSDREARWLWNRVHGIDGGSVHQRETARGLSRDETFSKDLHDDCDIERELLRLVTRAASDLRGDGLAVRTVAVRIRLGLPDSLDATDVARARDLRPRDSACRARAARQPARSTPRTRSSRRCASVWSAQVVESRSTLVVHDSGSIRRDRARSSVVEGDKRRTTKVRAEEHRPRRPCDRLLKRVHGDAQAFQAANR